MRLGAKPTAGDGLIGLKRGLSMLVGVVLMVAFLCRLPGWAGNQAFLPAFACQMVVYTALAVMCARRRRLAWIHCLVSLIAANCAFGIICGVPESLVLM